MKQGMNYCEASISKLTSARTYGSATPTWPGVVVALIVWVFGCTSGKLLAQAPPGPLPPPPTGTAAPPQQAPPQPKKEQPQARKTLAGYWKVNVDESDDPNKKRQDSGPAGGSGGPMGGPRVGIGFPYPGSGGPWGWPGGGGPTGPNGPNDPNERDQNDQTVRRPYSLRIAINNPELDLTDDTGHMTVFYTDGRKIQKDKNSNTDEVSARWDGNRLISDERSARGRKMSRTFELSSDGTQLYETLRIERGGSNAPLVMHYVFDASAQRARE